MDNMMFIWDNMVERGIATNEELGLACALCGSTEHTLLRVLAVRTGYSSMEAFLEDEEYEDSEEGEDYYE